jgi:glycosyltransferase involved in cell wall biosynthesis
LALLARENHRPPLSFKHAICVSAATRTGLVGAGLPLAHARVIHTGIDAQPYLDLQPEPRSHHDNQDLKLLYAGRLVEEKGVDTAILALEKLRAAHGLRRLRLTVAGSESADYESHLRRMVTQAGLDEQVTFLGHVPAEEMPRLLQQFDVLLIPSIWPEPFSRMLLEGMISGLVVVATSTGGTPEIVTDDENGLLFAPGDAEGLARGLLRLTADPTLRCRLAQAGRQTVIERYTETTMMDEIEGYLQEVAGTPARAYADRLEQ